MIESIKHRFGKITDRDADSIRTTVAINIYGDAVHSLFDSTWSHITHSLRRFIYFSLVDIQLGINDD